MLLLAFAFIGRWSHHELSGGGLWATLGTAAPFLLGWAAVAPPLGVYGPAHLRTRRAALTRVIVAWPLALVVALLIRSIVDLELPAAAFVLVALLFNLLTLSLWRVVLISLRYSRWGEHGAY